jgi:hypothetical protein
MPTSQVYVNWGRIVAECWCGDARVVEIGQQTMTCCISPSCPGHTNDLEWPDNLPAIVTALSERLSEKRKNWFPPGHPFAIAGGYPTGQTPDELRAETATGEAADAQVIAERRAALLEELQRLDAEAAAIDDFRRMV